ncbi:hypothetical protein A2311_04115 [candidate division WOR-1 bacterium RIFOXYB2_FULL_48_7]|uniref:S1 motif domain-containing protein n=1 Tax=candidate division WOR-1 bacterium RIFOXYB2_FULL_48_7 TaxID=1802583 RepID=A0A1F4TXD9_UNCSA|nr:MAG: hypothetical protein A2311_04115 [candidate division WOR-1 bacterium RIFOXYB2_FULL_48_7]
MNNYSGTQFDKSKGDAGLSEVEELIRQTLEDSKKLEKPANQPAAPVSEPPKDDFKATVLPSQPAKPKPAAPIAPQQIVKPQEKSAPTSYEATFKEYQIGDIVQGKVLKVDQSGVLVDIKYKADGLILNEELSDHPGSSQSLKPGETIYCLIENLENKEGYVVLSQKKADFERKWKVAAEAYRNRTVLEAKVLQALKGGLVVDSDGLRGFVPASQVGKSGEETLESFAGKTIPVKVIDVNRRQGKIVMSHKLAAGDKDKLVASKLFEELEVGQVRKGKVANLKQFGAFVDLGGVEGLIHLSELSWKRVKHPSELLKTGDEIEVLVIGVDKVNRKVSLGLKELQADPWANAAELYKPGQVIKAKVLRFAKFGAFVELEHGLEGLIHLSELSKEHIKTPDEAIKIGDTVDVKVLRVIPEEQKIGLSIKALLVEKDKQALKEAAATADNKKVTIADMVADKERAKAEKEAELAEEGEEEQAPIE